MTTFLSGLQWRNATKAFDPQKKVSEDDLQKILEAIRYAPTSYGLQPFHVFVISDMSVRQKIAPVAWNQSQITEASHLLVFCSRSDVAPDRIEDYIEEATGGDEKKKEALKGYADMMRGSFQGKSSEQQKIWADRQTYIALGFGLAAAAELRIDSCPMEGFSPPEVDKVLALPEHLHSVAFMTIGYRRSDPDHPKVRFPEEELFTMM
jgi:nitroreductase